MGLGHRGPSVGAFLKIIWHGNRHSTGLQSISARAMASICVHRASQTPPGIAPGHIGSRDDLQEEPQPATHSRQCPIPRFPAIHLTRQSPFYGPPGHIRSRDGINLCPSSDPNPSKQHSRAYRLARWFAGRSSTCHRPATHSRQSPSRTFREIHLAPQSAFQGPPGRITVPGGTKLGSPGPFS